MKLLSNKFQNDFSAFRYLFKICNRGKAAGFCMSSRNLEKSIGLHIIRSNDSNAIFESSFVGVVECRFLGLLTMDELDVSDSSACWLFSAVSGNITMDGDSKLNWCCCGGVDNILFNSSSVSCLIICVSEPNFCSFCLFISSEYEEKYEGI